MASLNISDKTAELLSARATAEGTSIDEVLQRLVRNGNVAAATAVHAIAPADLDRLIDQELSDAPLLPADFSREDIYADHD
jgi:hypothetical protein